MVLKTHLELEPDDVEESTEVRDVTAEDAALVTLTPMSSDVAPSLAEFRVVVEEALVRQEQRLAHREAVIRDQAQELARIRQELRHVGELQEARDDVVVATTRRLKATNHNLRTALDERDRRLVTFARKVASIRQDRDDQIDSRAAIIAELRRLRFYQRARRAELLAELERVS